AQGGGGVRTHASAGPLRSRLSLHLAACFALLSTRLASELLVHCARTVPVETKKQTAAKKVPKTRCAIASPSRVQPTPARAAYNITGLNSPSPAAIGLRAQ